MRLVGQGHRKRGTCWNIASIPTQHQRVLNFHDHVCLFRYVCSLYVYFFRQEWHLSTVIKISDYIHPVVSLYNEFPSLHASDPGKNCSFSLIREVLMLQSDFKINEKNRPTCKGISTSFCKTRKRVANQIKGSRLERFPAHDRITDHRDFTQLDH